MGSISKTDAFAFDVCREVITGAMHLTDETKPDELDVVAVLCAMACRFVPPQDVGRLGVIVAYIKDELPVQDILDQVRARDVYGLQSRLMATVMVIVSFYRDHMGDPELVNILDDMVNKAVHKTGTDLDKLGKRDTVMDVVKDINL
jgi:hypothetical protein